MSRKKRHLARSLIAILFGGVILISGIKQLLALYERRQLLMNQTQCMEFLDPPGMVIYEEDPVATTRLLSSPAGDSYENWKGAHRKVPKGWENYPIAPPGPGPVVFLHSRNVPDGETRLVEVEFDWYGNAEHYRDFNWVVIRPGVGETKACIVNRSLGERFPRSGAQSMRLFAAKIDPADSSHFTIDFQVANGPIETIDGWLTMDDKVVTKIRETRAETPSTLIKRN